jgi:hypothetical protein
MKNLTLFAFLTLIVLVCSCKKNNDNQTPVNPASSLIKSMIFTDTTGKYIASMSFQYDSQGKIIQMIFDNPPDIDSLIYKYEYYPSMVIEKIFYRNNDKYGRTVYYLNSDGLAISETDMGYNQNGDSSVGQTVTYKYNTDGYMLEKKSYLYGDTATWISYNWQIMNGNITSMELSLSLWGGGSVTESYEYIPNSVNTLGNTNAGKMFLGKSSTNLIKSSITNNTTPKSGTYSYAFDSMNRVIQEFIRGDGLMTSTVNLTFTYY